MHPYILIPVPFTYFHTYSYSVRLYVPVVLSSFSPYLFPPLFSSFYLCVSFLFKWFLQTPHVQIRGWLFPQMLCKTNFSTMTETGVTSQAWIVKVRSSMMLTKISFSFPIAFALICNFYFCRAFIMNKYVRLIPHMHPKSNIQDRSPWWSLQFLVILDQNRWC